MSKRDSYIILGLALALTYANLLGPQRLIDQLFPGGGFVGKSLASALVPRWPEWETRGVTAKPPALAPLPAPVRAAQPRPLAKPAL